MNEVMHNVDEWLEENQKCFHPPICVKTMYEGQMIAFFVGGPNVREDYHLEEGDEFFYQIKGDMYLKVIEKGKPRNIHIKEGEVFLLPKRILHSPQRFKDTIGFVTERKRRPQEMDCVRYYTDNYKEILYEKWLHLNDDFSEQISSAIKDFMKSEQHLTGKPIAGTITENPPFMDDRKRILEDPFSLSSWIEKHKDEIEHKGEKKLFEGDYTFMVIVYGKGTRAKCYSNADTVLWQLERDSEVTIEDKHYQLQKNNIILIKSGQKWKLRNEDSAFTLSITTFPV